MNWHQWLFSVIAFTSLFSTTTPDFAPAESALPQPARWSGTWTGGSVREPMRGWLGLTAEGRPVEAWYFPGQSEERALILGGVHGSELSSVEVVRQLVQDLQGGFQPYYTLIVVPCIFPDNAATAELHNEEIGSVKNVGRYSFTGAIDPNRQMPAPGKAFDAQSGVDFLGRVIERENQYLLDLIQSFKPQRIASVHAIRDEAKAGFFADPRTDALGIALGFESDSVLVMQMAQKAIQSGYRPRGNYRGPRPTAHYHLDPSPVKAGHWQARNTSGSRLRGHCGRGISLGTWASTAVSNESDTLLNRPALQMITIEFPGSYRPGDGPVAETTKIQQTIHAYTAALRDVFCSTP